MVAGKSSIGSKQKRGRERQREQIKGARDGKMAWVGNVQ